MLARIHDAGAISVPLVRQIDRFTRSDRNVLTCHIVARTAAIGLAVTFALDATRHLMAGVVRLPVAVVLLAWDRTRCRAMTHDIGRHLSLTIRYLALAVFGTAPVVAVPWKAIAVVEWVGHLSLAPPEKSFAARVAAACTQAWRSPYVRAVACLTVVAALGAAGWHFAPFATIEEEPSTPSPLPPPTPDPIVSPLVVSAPVPAFEFPMPSYQVMRGVALAACSLGGACYVRPKVVALAARVQMVMKGIKKLATRDMIFGFPPKLLVSLAVGIPVGLFTSSCLTGVAVGIGITAFAEKKIKQWRIEANNARAGAVETGV